MSRSKRKWLPIQKEHLYPWDLEQFTAQNLNLSSPPLVRRWQHLLGLPHGLGSLVFLAELSFQKDVFAMKKADRYQKEVFLILPVRGIPWIQAFSKKTFSKRPVI